MQAASMDIVHINNKSGGAGSARFRRTFKDSDFRYQYSSDNEHAICCGHFFLSKIAASELGLKHMFLLEADNEKLIAINISERVQGQQEGAANELIALLQYDLQTADVVWSTSVASQYLEPGINTRLIADKWFDDIPNEYQLTKNSVAQKAVIASIALLLVGSGYFGYHKWIAKPATQPVKTVTVDPWSAWRSAVTSQYNASHALKEATKLYSYGVLMPIGWQLKPIQLINGSLELTASRNERGLIADWDAFLVQNPSLAQFTKPNSEDGAIRIPLPKNGNSTEIPDITGMATPLYDSLVRLGVGDSIAKVTETKGNYIEHRYSFSLSGVSYAMLDALSQLFDGQPIYLTQLSVKPAGTEDRLTTDIEMNITLQGVNHE